MRFYIIIGIILCFKYDSLLGQGTGVNQDFVWLNELIDSIETQTTLCADCPEFPEIKSYLSSGQQRFRLRYSCSSMTSVTRYYDGNGTSVGVCIVEDNFRDCEDVSAYTSFTFGTDIKTYWSCTQGTLCEEEKRLGLFPIYNLEVVDDPCSSEIKNLSVSTKFESYQWLSPSGNASVDSSFLASESGSYQVIVENHSGCLDTTEVVLDIGSEAKPKIVGDTIICDSGGVNLSLEGFQTYEWSNGDNSPSTTYYEEGIVSVILEDENQCEQTAQLFIRDLSHRNINLQLNQDPVYENQRVLVSYDVDWEFQQGFEPAHMWTINNAIISAGAPIIEPVIPNTTEIGLSFEDENGCIRRDEIIVVPEPVSKVFYVPNVIYPFSNSQNDRFYFQAPPSTIQLEKVIVYNRWGHPVYKNDAPELNSYDNGWDCRISGNLIGAGTYIFYAEMTFLDGSRKSVSGEFVLIY